MIVPILRTGDLSLPVNIIYGVTPDNATQGVDYVDTDGTVRMEAGQDRVYVPVTILDDGLSEPTESFVVSIINVDSGMLLFPRTARVSILDNENPVTDPVDPPLVSDYDVADTVIASGLVQPIALEFAPHDPSLIYIAEKRGIIKVFDLDTGTVTGTFLDLLPYLYPFRVLRCSRFCPPGTGLHTRPVRAHSSSNAAGVHCSRPSMR